MVVVVEVVVAAVGRVIAIIIHLRLDVEEDFNKNIEDPVWDPIRLLEVVGKRKRRTTARIEGDPPPTLLLSPECRLMHNERNFVTMAVTREVLEAIIDSSIIGGIIKAAVEGEEVDGMLLVEGDRGGFRDEDEGVIWTDPYLISSQRCGMSLIFCFWTSLEEVEGLLIGEGEADQDE